MTGTTSTTPAVDLIFPAMGSAVPCDHGYSLYGALCRIVPWLHDAETKKLSVGVFSIRGIRAGDGSLLLNERSTVRIRTPADRLPSLLPLAGKLLEIDGFRVRLGVPQVAAIEPASVLSSQLVLIKIAHANGQNGVTPENFLAAAKKQLAEMEIPADPGLPLYREGPRKDQPRRRTIRVKEQTHVGYALIVQGLTADESIRLQEQGLGGRRLMGCGLFLPERGRS